MRGMLTSDVKYPLTRSSHREAKHKLEHTHCDKFNAMAVKLCHYHSTRAATAANGPQVLESARLPIYARLGVRPTDSPHSYRALQNKYCVECYEAYLMRIDLKLRPVAASVT